MTGTSSGLLLALSVNRSLSIYIKRTDVDSCFMTSNNLRIHSLTYSIISHALYGFSYAIHCPFTVTALEKVPANSLETMIKWICA